MGESIRTRLNPALLILPFVIIVGVTVARTELGNGWGMLPMLVVGPAVAAAIGGALYTLAAGLVAMASALHFVLTMSTTAEGHRSAVVTLLAAGGVTIAGILAGRVRSRRDRQLAEVQLVAESAQRVVLHPVPRRAGPVRLAVRYLSASSGARIGGDLYDVATMPDRVRMIVGDVEGKGLAAVQVAAATLGSFREAAFEEDCLAGVVSRIETSLSRQFPDQQDQQFVTAVFAEISADEQKMELISCGHPAPLLLSPGEGPQPAPRPAGCRWAWAAWCRHRGSARPSRSRPATASCSIPTGSARPATRRATSSRSPSAPPSRTPAIRPGWSTG